MKVVRKVCQLMERCDAHGRSVRELGEVQQLSGSATAIKELCRGGYKIRKGGGGVRVAVKY